MNAKKHATHTAKSASRNASAERILSARLRELGIDPGGLPSHVTAHLRAVVDDEAQRILDALAAKVAALEAQTDDQLRAKVARLVTFKSVGKAFALPTQQPPGGAAK